MGTPQTMWVDESERWVPIWVDAVSKKCQICVVQMAKNPGPSLGTISLGQAVKPFSFQVVVFISARS